MQRMVANQEVIMKREDIEIRGSIISVVTNIDMKLPAFTYSLCIRSGPFALMGLGDPEPRKALIATLIEADKELDAAAEARKGRVA